MNIKDSPRILAKWVVLVAVFGAGVAATLGVTAWLRSPAWESLAGNRGEALDLAISGSQNVVGEMLAANRAVFQAPTPPPNRPRITLPWEPSRYVLIQLPLKDFASEPALLEIYTQFLAAVLPEIPVMALFHKDETEFIPPAFLEIEAKLANPALMDDLTLVPSDTRSIWIRDYGPIFGTNRKRQLLVYDNSFRDTRVETSNYLKIQSRTWRNPQDPGLTDYYDEMERIRGDDIAPPVVAAHLNLYHRNPSILVRPPLAIPGGDFVPVSTTDVLISQSTLEGNGGRADLMEDLLKRYYGLENVHYLSHLPGKTINHLDFIIAPMGDDVILVAAPPAAPAADRVYQRLIHRAIVKVLQSNKDYLIEHFPRHRIIEVPMPPLAIESDIKVLEKLTFNLVQHVAALHGMAAEGIFEPDPAKPDEQRLNPKLWAQIKADTGVSTLSDPGEISRATQFYFGKSSDRILQLYVENFTYYRSYLNSLLVVTKSGNEQILIPRYQPRTQAEADQLAETTRRVESAYREARPRAKLTWIDCDYFVEDLGAIHCFAVTIPEAK